MKKKSLSAKKAKPQHAHSTGKHHLDKRADLLLTATEAAGNDDDLLENGEVALWLRVSEVWLSIGRAKNYGPPFVQLSPGVIRYQRGNIKKWLRSRTFANTAEYQKPDKPRRSSVEA